MKYLVCCPNCGKIYKCSKVTYDEVDRYITDFGDDVTDKCLCCGHNIAPTVLTTEDWVADMVFIVKGER